MNKDHSSFAFFDNLGIFSSWCVVSCWSVCALDKPPGCGMMYSNKRSFVCFVYYSMKKVGVSVSQPSGFSPNLVGKKSGFSRDLVGPTKQDKKSAPALDVKIQCRCFSNLSASRMKIHKISIDRCLFRVYTNSTKLSARAFNVWCFRKRGED